MSRTSTFPDWIAAINRIEALDQEDTDRCWREWSAMISDARNDDELNHVLMNRAYDLVMERKKASLYKDTRVEEYLDILKAQEIWEELS